MGQDISNAEDAFSVLGSRLRVQILEALADGSDQEPLSFTELYEAVDSSNTSQFSYHLKELTGRYVQQTAFGDPLGEPTQEIVAAVLLLVAFVLLGTAGAEKCPANRALGRSTYDERRHEDRP
ncbi:helix-turn-helix transcriptional regulator [Haloterrigena sp. H1]|uniref:ArsR/SmtB family transcription factor n=1 Tax=Haloterrigena sp. H1 TaxID=2552943 RepID=UPI0014873C68|nr:helix-turn-helix transcriptional regulator [Haloterrigena sp. H1]